MIASVIDPPEIKRRGSFRTLRVKLTEYIGRFIEPTVLAADEVATIADLYYNGKWNEGAAIIFAKECVVRRLMEEDKFRREFARRLAEKKREKDK